MQENGITLTADARDAFAIDAELKNHANNVVGEMIEIGRCLKEINDRRLYEYLDTNTFEEYAEKAVGLKKRAAYNYIKAYETYGAEGLNKYSELGITKLVALAQLNEPDRAELLESGEAAELSSRKLNEKIKELKGENDQLRFEAEDAETAAKNNALKIAALQKEIAENRKKLAARDSEIDKLKEDLTEAQRPVVASMSEEEKDEIRKEAEKQAKAAAEDEIKRLKKQVENAEKNVKDQDKINNEQANRIAELSDALEAAATANAQLQANAQKPRPALSGNKEALKFCLEDVQQQFTRAVEIVSSMEQEEKAKFRAALAGIAEKLKTAAEGIA